MDYFVKEIKFFSDDDIESAAHEAQALANNQDKEVIFKFNSIECIARPKGDAFNLISQYRELIKDGVAVS